MAAANAIDVDTAMLKLHEAHRDAPTLPDLPVDADAIELARAYADALFRIIDREKRTVSVLDSLVAEVKWARRDIVALKRELADHRAELANERTASAKRHAEIVTLISQLGPGYR